MSIFAAKSVQILLIKRPLLRALRRHQSDIRDQKHDRKGAGELRSISTRSIKTRPSRAQDYSPYSLDNSELCRYCGGAIGADQSRGTNPRIGAGGDDADVIQYRASGCNPFRDADFSGDESVE